MEGKGEKQVDEPGGPPSFIPDCTVRFDDLTSCGINVRVIDDQAHTFVELAVVTGMGGRLETHDLTLEQAEQLRAVLDQITRSYLPQYELRARPGGRSAVRVPVQVESRERAA